MSLTNKIKNLEKQTNLIFSKISDVVISITEAITICAYIRDTSQKVLSGATIKGATAYAISKDDGYFEIEVASLSDIITIRFMGFKTIERKAQFFNLNSCEIISMLEEEQVISPVVLNGYLVQGIDKRQDGSTLIDYSKFTLLPGLIESDVLQTVQALPGIISVDETVSNINIRGGSHDQNLMLWDDIKMYQSGHFFGLISSFNPQITQTATVINNGTDASYSDGVSGSIFMESDKKLQSKFEGSFGINLLNADLFADVPLGEKSSVQIAARKSTDDLLRTPTYDTYFDRVTQETEAQNNSSEVSNSNQGFDFYDTSLRWLYQPTDKDIIRLNFILINNNLSFDETATLNGALETRESSVSQNSMAAGLNYKREWNSNLSTTLNIYNTDYKLQAINANILAGQRFLQENSVSETAIKLEALYHQNLWKFMLGYNFVESEVVNLNDIDLPRFVRRDSEVLREHAVFGQTYYENEAKDFSVRSGVRLNYIDEFNELIIEPRLNIRKALGNHFEIEALGEFKHQNVSQIVNFQNDFLGIEKRRWQQTDNDSIPILKSKQASLGILYKNKGWLVDVKGYFKTVAGITTQSQSFTTKYELEKEKGSYDAYGVEVLFRKKFKHLNSWLSYSYINNTYTFETLEDKEFPSNFDITHAFTMGSTFSNTHWNISAGLNYRTGQPTSIPLLGNEVIDDAVNFDTANSSRLQDYMRIDVSALYKFKISNSFRSEIGASVWNLSNRENPINNFYRVNDNNDPIKFSRFSLGITTNAVWRLYF
ncbi:TonB-dependent receptor [Subsaximicrobium wynnwilliamsii]|uniref:TonB-dependent receptor n=1 Tax=Subsaximicrobium wynnwilliamsii TaxID=291179 RepID=UPI001675077A|nr:TonB-dependent receptor [Subsaximicrobium wynnwilliamsii]